MTGRYAHIPGVTYPAPRMVVGEIKPPDIRPRKPKKSIRRRKAALDPAEFAALVRNSITSQSGSKRLVLVLAGEA